MNDLLFAVPWWLPALLTVIGIALVFNGNKRQVTKVRNAGAGLMVLASVWGLVSYFVDTDKEKVEKATRQIVQTVVDGDWNTFQSRLTPSATLVFNERARATGAATITGTAKASVESVRLKSAHVQSFVFEENGPVIAVRCDIFSQQENIVPTETSSWKFEWEKTGKEWKLREIRLIALKGVATDEIRDVFPRGK